MMAPLIQRATELETLRFAWNEPQTRYLHVWGIGGAGKTTIVRQLLSESDTPTIEFQCRLATQMDLRSLMRRMDCALLNPKQIEELHNKKQKALVDAGYQQASREHRISLAENAKIIAQGNVVAGDMILKSDAQYDRELLEECRLHLELLASLLGPCTEPVCTIFLDSLEAVDEINNQLCQWLSIYCLQPPGNALVPIRVVTTSRWQRGLNSPAEAKRILLVGAMKEDEANSLLQHHGVADQKTREWLISITRAHPQALVLASRLTEIIDMDNLAFPSQSSAVYEELCTEILLRSVLEHEPDDLVRRAMTRVPIFRFFTPEGVSALLHCSAEETQHIITTLKDGGFLEITVMALKYHDFLRDLTLRFIQTSSGVHELRALHQQAAGAFRCNPEDNGLIGVVEPFYHLLNGDLAKAVEYSEMHIKPALDRKERTLSAILLNQIDFDTLLDTPYKGWLLLRYGGYFREFRDFPKAVAIFEKIPAMADTDERLLASVLNNLGWVYLYWGGSKHVEVALDFLEKSNTICRKHGYINILAMNLNNMGIAHSRKCKGDDQEELECYNQCLSITESEQSRNYLVSGMALQNAGLVYQKRHEYGLAFATLCKALERFRACHCPQREGEVIYLLACVLFDSKEYLKSREFLDVSLSALQARPDGDPYYLTENFFALARVLERLGEHENMRQCLLSMVMISLMVTVDYHIVVAQRTVQFCCYLFAKHGKIFTLETLEYLSSKWIDSEVGRNFAQFSDFLSSQTEVFRQYSFWSNRESLLFHLPASRCCKPRKWESVTLRETDRDTLALCKRCQSTVEVTDEPANVWQGVREGKIGRVEGEK